MKLIIDLVLLYLVNIYQYTAYINNSLYLILLLILIFISLITKKNLLVMIFFSFILFEDFPKYINGNFNSIYFGLYKNFVFIGIYICSIIKILLKRERIKNNRMYIYNLFLYIYILLSLLNKNNWSYAMTSLNVYICIFIIPFSLKLLLKVEDSKKILDILNRYMYTYPILGVLLLLLKNGYNFSGYTYIFFGPFKLFILAYIVGDILNKFNKFKMIILLMNLGIILMAPSSGEILMVILILLLAIYKKIFKVKLYKKVILVLVGLLSSIGFILKIKQKYLNLKSGDMLKLKIDQILGLFNLMEIDKLPYSLKIRVIQLINILKGFNYKTVFFSSGFGSFYTDNYLKFPEFDKSTFSEYEISNRIYYNAHFIGSMLLLKFGIIGLIIFIEYTIKVIREVKGKYQFLWIVVLYSSYWGIKNIIIWSFVYGAIIQLEKEEKKYD